MKLMIHKSIFSSRLTGLLLHLDSIIYRLNHQHVINCFVLIFARVARWLERRRKDLMSRVRIPLWDLGDGLSDETENNKVAISVARNRTLTAVIHECLT
jgi:hypothetical protein